MSEVHWKRRSGADAAGFLATEAAGLAWIRVPGGPPIPDVVEVGACRSGIPRVPEARPSAAAARQLGGRLAVLHRAGAPAFGSPPPGAPGPDGWIGDLPMPYAERATFADFWATDRIVATARMARDRGGLDARQTAEVDRFGSDLRDGQVDIGLPGPAARVHGDLWSGNVLWGADGQAWLIDPAAHGGVLMVRGGREIWVDPGPGMAPRSMVSAILGEAFDTLLGQLRIMRPRPDQEAVQAISLAH